MRPLFSWREDQDCSIMVGVEVLEEEDKLFLDMWYTVWMWDPELLMSFCYHE